MAGILHPRPDFTLHWSDRTGKKFRLVLGPRTLLMGILNVTPDSFYDGGRYLGTEEAIERARVMEEEGADIIDIGGESSRPGSLPLSAGEELKRVLPVLEGLSGKLGVPVSIDTCKAEVARRALEAGAQIINDISALRFDPRLPEVVAASSGPLIMMHMLGTPATMQHEPVYRAVAAEIKDFFRERLRAAAGWGIKPGRIILDPGIGFGKTVEHNLEIIAGLGGLAELGRPILIGPSRKSFIGAVTRQPAEGRFWGTAGAVAAGVAAGAHIVRVHDVKEMKEVTTVLDAIIAAGGQETC